MLRDALDVMTRPETGGHPRPLSAVEEVLLAMPMAAMLEVLPQVASEQPVAWTAALLSTCPLAAEALTMRWEEQEHEGEGERGEGRRPGDMQSFFAAVLAGPGMDSEAVRQHLVGAKDALARQLALDLLESSATTAV